MQIIIQTEKAAESIPSLSQLAEELNKRIGATGFFVPEEESIVTRGTCANSELHNKLIGLLLMFYSCNDSGYISLGYNGRACEIRIINNKSRLALSSFISGFSHVNDVKMIFKS